MKLDKTTTLLIISCVLWFLSIVMLFSSASKHNKELAAMQANRELITKELCVELTESAKYDSITKELSAQSGTQYYALVNYLKSQGATISEEKTREIPETNLQASSLTAFFNNCSIDSLYKHIYHAEQELGLPRFRVASIELQTKSNNVSSSTQPPLSAKIIFETITTR